MNLSVPLFRQSKDSYECGPIGLLMVLHYYGYSYTEDEVLREIGVQPGVGTYIPQLGSFMIDQGFEVTIITRHPSLFSRQEINNPPGDMLQYFLEYRHSFYFLSQEDQIAYEHYVAFLRKGGNIVVDTPSMRHIRQEIDEGRPMGVNLTADAIAEQKLGFTFHFNIVTGYDEERVMVNDPLPGNGGGNMQHSQEDFLYATHATAYGGIDNACFITFRKRR